MVMYKWLLFLFVIFYPIQSHTCMQEYYLKFINTYPQYTIYKVDVSFYTLSPDETDNSPEKGALNTRLIVGKDVAVSRDLLFLLGKKVYIEGFGIRTVSDVMHKRYKNRIDILVSNKKLAKKLGVKRNVKLVILPERLR